MLVDVFLVVGDDRFGDGLTDSVDLGSVSTTRDANTDVDVSCKITVSVSRVENGEKIGMESLGIIVPNLSTPRIRTGS